MKYRYEPCPKCVANGKDSRGDNLVVYDSGHGHCFAIDYAARIVYNSYLIFFGGNYGRTARVSSMQNNIFPS